MSLLSLKEGNLPIWGTPSVPGPVPGLHTDFLTESFPQIKRWRRKLRLGVQLLAQGEARVHSARICLPASLGSHSALPSLTLSRDPTSPATQNPPTEHDQRRGGRVCLEPREKAGRAASCSLGPMPSREQYPQLSPLVCKAIRYAESHLVPGQRRALSHRR